eukprot:m.75425 g.75425  ORF g.75425 m.75425 type:complete len:462 (-) comp12500_c0_seq2:72-1457(-)
MEKFDDGKEVTMTLQEAMTLMGHGLSQYRVLLVCGLCFMSDSIEIGMLSFLQIKAREEFELSSVGESTLSSMVFVGEILGALFWGPYADRFGRWNASVASAVLMAAAGVASALSVNFEMLVSMRFIVGIGIGGLSVPFDVLAEFVQPRLRGRSLMAVEFFWCVGTMASAGIAWAMLERYGWRWFVAVCSAPVILALFAFYWLPESPHWLLVRGRQADAVKVIRKCAKANGRLSEFPTNLRLVREKTNAENEEQASLLETSGDHDEKESMNPIQLFQKSLWKTTSLLWVVWLCFGFSYYGTVLIMPKVLPNPDGSDFNYPALFVSSTAELIGCSIGFIIIDKVGRRWSHGVGYSLCSGFIALLILEGPPIWVRTAFIMIARASIFIASSTTWIATPELYPTNVRAAGHSWCNGLARIGASVTPYWGDSKYSLGTILGVYSGVGLLAAASSASLRETLGALLG